MTEAPAPPAHVSYSQLSSWLRCGKAYELERVIHVPGVAPTWAQVAGSAVHTGSERMDCGDITPVRDLWLDVFAEHIELEEERSGVSNSKWRATGRKTRALPHGEDFLYWKAEGAACLHRWKAWRAANKEKWQIVTLTVPGGTEKFDGIELPLNIRFGEVVVQAVVDRLFANAAGDLLVVDLKSGTWTPKDAGQQLGLYAAGIEQQFGVRPKTGAYWMARSGDFANPPMNLDHFSDHYWTQTTAQLAKAKAESIFLPNPGMFCGSCSVRDYCATQGGKLAHLADSLCADS